METDRVQMCVRRIRFILLPYKFVKTTKKKKKIVFKLFIVWNRIFEA